MHNEAQNEVFRYSYSATQQEEIRRIREKIELNPSEPEYLKVVWGIGYEIEKH